VNKLLQRESGCKKSWCKCTDEEFCKRCQFNVVTYKALNGKVKKSQKIKFNNKEL